MGEGVHALLYKTKRFLKQRGAITLLLILANVLTFIVLECLGSTEDERFMFYHGAAFTPSILLSHEYYRLFTSMFLHFGIQHLFNNMVVLFFLGDVLEKQIGKTSFFLVYLLGGLGGNLLSLFVDVRTSQFAISAGASGAVFAIMGGLVFLLTVNKGKIPNISPRRFGIMVFLSLYQGFTSVGIDNYAHLGGLISGFFMTGLISFIHIKKQKKQQY
ncbi:MAG TPA: rhomboid family intramembrane serine protease [Candidatus Merdenecus merdavium]|nr:rhomboid family intramembrane serine protease [Candidatus Merdenecus merdavium]